MQAGDPQGAILSLIIYNIFTHDVPDIPSLLLAKYAHTAATTVFCQDDQQAVEFRNKSKEN